MPNASAFYRKKLPHLQPVGGTFFVTFRLKGSIPKQQLDKLFDKQERELIAFKKTKPDDVELHDFFLSQLFAFDNLLDQIEAGPHYLKKPEIANIVAKKLVSYDGKLYDLLAYCVMSNHVHILIDTSIQIDNGGRVPKNYKQLNEIMRLIKGGSAREANKLLFRSGAFWETESYDHWVRNHKSLTNILNYIIENPLKAGLVKHWRDWPYSYAKGYM